MSTIDFLPPSYAAAQARRRQHFRLALLLTVAAAGIGGWYLMTSRQLADLEHCAQAKAQAAQVAQERVNEIQALRTQCAALSHLVKVERQLLAPITNTQVLATIGHLMPASVSLTEVQIAAPSPADSGHDTVPMRITLTGQSPTDAELATFVERVSRFGLFENVGLEFTKTVTWGAGQARQFEVVLEVPLDRDYRPASANGGGVAVAH
jgi:Tfp pilus assembly protein PilO